MNIQEDKCCGSKYHTGTGLEHVSRVINAHQLYIMKVSSEQFEMTLLAAGRWQDNELWFGLYGLIVVDPVCSCSLMERGNSQVRFACRFGSQ